MNGQQKGEKSLMSWVIDLPLPVGDVLGRGAPQLPVPGLGVLAAPFHLLPLLLGGDRGHVSHPHSPAAPSPAPREQARHIPPGLTPVPAPSPQLGANQLPQAWLPRPVGTQRDWAPGGLLHSRTGPPRHEDDS